MFLLAWLDQCLILPIIHYTDVIYGYRYGSLDESEIKFFRFDKKFCLELGGSHKQKSNFHALTLKLRN